MLINELLIKKSSVYYNINKQTYLFTDIHVTGFGAMLAQGESIEEVKPTAVASKSH